MSEPTKEEIAECVKGIPKITIGGNWNQFAKWHLTQTSQLRADLQTAKDALKQIDQIRPANLAAIIPDHMIAEMQRIARETLAQLSGGKQ